MLRRGPDPGMNRAAEVAERRQASSEEQQAAQLRQHQRAMRERNPRYKPNVPFNDPDVKPSPVNRLGGRADAEAILVNIFRESQDFYGIVAMEMKKYLGSEFSLNEARRLFDDIWYSPSLGHYTSTRDVARAYQYFVGYQNGGRSFMASPLLAGAANLNEAASVLLQDLQIEAWERFIRHDELGYWESHDAGDGQRTWNHSRGKTTDIRERVKIRAAIRIPVMPGLSISPTVSYYGARSKPLINRMTNWVSELEDMEPFAGDARKMLNATPADLQNEMARLETVRRKNALKMFTAQVMAVDIKGFKFLGRDWTPGMLQSADELVDLGIDVAQTFRYVMNALGPLDDQARGDLIRVGVRRGVEATLEKMGIYTVNPEALVLHRPDLVQDLPGAVRTSRQVQTELNQFWGIVNSARAEFQGGNFIKGAATLTKMKNLQVSQMVKRHTVVYSQFTPIDISGRSLGRIMPIWSEQLGGVRPLMMMDINTLISDREINNTINQLKYAANRFSWQSVNKIWKEGYQEAKMLFSRGEAVESNIQKNYGGPRQPDSQALRGGRTTGN